MDSYKISDHVHYIGLNDRTTHLFEALWPLPFGVSYNSYLITSKDRCAIVDGVEASHALRQIELINKICGEKKPDYLIINHMEPDHSGGISLLRQAFPDITIVGNALTLGMVKGYYGIDNNTLTVKDGDTLELADDVTLSFAMTPMVHWPETMMTYLVQEKTLFSGDAFGCFGALNGAVVDTDMNVDHYCGEMIRYYSNIVGKYGRFVQRAFKRLEGVELQTVCTTHGPVWRDKIADVTTLYDKLSRYEPLDNGVTIIYGSMYGNTAMLAEEMAHALAQNGVRDIAIHNAAVSNLSYILADVFRHRGLVIASPTYSDSLFPPIRSVVEALSNRSICNRELALIGSHTWAQQAIKIMTQELENCNLVSVATPLNIKHAPDIDDLAHCREMGRLLAAKLTL